MSGNISYNVFDQVKMLKIGKEAKSNRGRGCFELDKLKKVFNETWETKISYMLCLMIYTTGMRNSEIEQIQVKDIIQIDDCFFIDITKSKTKNGIRKMPLHPFVHRKLMEYAKDLHPESYIFSAKGNHNQSILYKEANIDLGKCKSIGMTAGQLKEQRISFYSGRHFWKTLMNADGLGNDIEEFFMGHKVSNDVAKRYNHRDKQGKKMIIEKAKEVFAILDKRLL
jgi:integrase